MASSNRYLLDQFLIWWTSKIIRYPIGVLILAFIICGISLNYTINNLGVNTDHSVMLSPDLPFQKNQARLEQTFPQDAGTILLVIDAQSPEQAKSAVNDFGNLLRANKDVIEFVYVPGEGDFFEHAGLLYLDQDELEDLATELARAQPFIGRLSEDFSLDGLLSILGYAIKSDDDSIEIGPVLNKLSAALSAVLNHEYYQISWQELILGQDSNLVRSKRIAIIKPKRNFDELLPAEASLNIVRSLVGRVEARHPGTRIRMTGEVALEHEELQTVSKGATLAGISSLILVCLSLSIGLRSIKLVFATLICLITGLILTAGFAALAIGHLNIISVAFAVLYIGLGVDFAIHLCLRYREFVAEKFSCNEALLQSIRSVGPSITLCAVTTSIGFYAFIPTDYSGVSELGIISGTGMFIGIFTSLTVLPAFLKILPLKSVKPSAGFLPASLYEFPLQNSVTIRWVALILGVMALVVTSEVTFDSNPVNLRDPNSESVSTLKELLTAKDDSPLTLSVLAPDKPTALTIANNLKQLESVKETITLLDFIPTNQDIKLDIIDEVSLILGPQLNAFAHPVRGANTESALEEFLLSTEQAINTKQNLGNEEPYTLLRDRLQQFLQALELSEDKARMLKTLESSVLDLLPATMETLRKGFDATPISLTDLPTELSERWLSQDGVYRVMVVPKHDLNLSENIKTFVSDTQAIAPDITGLPVADQASGDAIVGAFQQAFFCALIAIFALLLLILRNIKHTLLVMFPLLLAGTFTCASTVLLNTPFNFANIIALPLLLGLGVDSGIHIINRIRATNTTEENPLKTSTSRGIFFSGLTTLVSFSSLAFTAHLGTASMGLLLAIGILLMLICTLVVLPAFYGFDTPQPKQV